MSAEMLQQEGRCKLCKRPVVLEIHRDCPPLNIDMWQRMVCCERCHRYAVRLNSMRAILETTGMELHTARVMWTDKAAKQESLRSFEQAVRSKLPSLTKSIASHVCSHYGKQTVWEQDFVEQIMEQPQRAKAIVATYISMVQKFSH